MIDIFKLKRQLASDPDDEETLEELIRAARRQGPEFTLGLYEELGFLDIDADIQGFAIFKTQSEFVLYDLMDYITQYYGDIKFKKMGSVEDFDLEEDFLNAPVNRSYTHNNRLRFDQEMHTHQPISLEMRKMFPTSLDDPFDFTLMVAVHPHNITDPFITREFIKLTGREPERLEL